MSKRERHIALAAFSFIAAAVVYNFILDPVIHQWQTLGNEASSKKITLKSDLKMAREAKALEANYEKFSKYVRSAESEDETMAQTLSFLEDLSRSDSCTVLNIKPVGTKDFGSYKEILIDLSSEADASRFTKFLYDVENAKEMILKVRHFLLTAKSGQEGTLRGSFLISKTIVK